jgi:hypothetical protein
VRLTPDRAGRDARLMPAKYVRAYCKGQKNDFRDAEAVPGSGHYGPFRTTGWLM